MLKRTTASDNNDDLRGFTIVELLIVIVVIGILAAITIVAYNGIQQRATTAAVTSAVDQWEKIIRMELALQGDFAQMVGGCLGRSAEDFPQTDEFAAGECLKENGASIDTSVSYDGDAFNGWTVDRPAGDLPKTTTRIDSISIKSRGIYGFFIPAADRVQQKPAAYLQWVPQISGSCGRGKSSLAQIPAGMIGGDLCFLLIE